MTPVSKLREQGLDTVFLAAPTSTERRLRLVAEHSSGFVYLVSRTGVTGEQKSLSNAAAPLIERMRKIDRFAAGAWFRHQHAGPGGRSSQTCGWHRGRQRHREMHRSECRIA